MNEEKILGIVQELMHECYGLKSQFFTTAAERTVYEAELRQQWDQIQTLLEDMISIQQHANNVQLLEDRCVELRERCDDLESENIELISRNNELAEDRLTLMQKLNDISEVINRIWS